MTRFREEEDINFAEVVNDAAHEDSWRHGFSIADLTDSLIAQGLWGDLIPRHTRGRRAFLRGCRGDTKDIIKRQTLMDGGSEFMALSEGEKAVWKLWNAMNRKEARQAYNLLRRKHKQLGIDIRLQRKRHIERFKEDPEDFLDKEE